jgi:hypothetical protein
MTLPIFSTEFRHRVSGVHPVSDRHEHLRTYFRNSYMAPPLRVLASNHQRRRTS